VNYKQRAALLILGIAALCGLTLWGVARWRYRGLTTTAQWLERLPARDAVVFYLDFDALRQAGFMKMLAGSKVAEEPEYKVFVMKTGFDYTRDLGAVLGCFTPQAKYLVVRGRFHWDTLESYVREQSGTCHNVLCRMGGSTPDRKISFFPMRPDLMALAVSPDESAVVELESAAARRRSILMPDAPVWLSIPPDWLKNSAGLPEGTRLFAHSLENTEDVNISVAPQGGRFEARLNVQCRDEQQAAVLAGQLQRITVLLGEMIAREKQAPNPRDLSGVLTAGTFQHLGVRVLGSWPIERGFLEDLLTGS
jgi:hypothetical protein